MAIKIVDTTLRDGEQRPGIALSCDEKVEIAKILDSLGIYQIEAGIPAMGGEEKKAVAKIANSGLKALVSAWNRMNINDIRNSLECDPDFIHISVPVSDLQIYKKLNMNRELVVKRFYECMEFAFKRHNNISIGFEDASRADKDFILRISDIAFAFGVKRVRYADTVGIMYQRSVVEGIELLKPKWGCNIEIHAHNDLGMAVGNSISACLAGAEFVNTTIAGMGERAGNCDYQKFLKASTKYFPDFMGINEKRTGHICRHLTELILAPVA